MKCNTRISLLNEIFPKPNETIMSEFNEIMTWLLAGTKQWSKVCGHVEPLPGISTEEALCCYDKD